MSYLGNRHGIAKVHFQTMAIKSFYAQFYPKTVIFSKTVKFLDTFSYPSFKKMVACHNYKSPLSGIILIRFQ
jgi:hypothetical protein